MDLADKTLVEDSSRGADTSVIQDVAVSGILLLASTLSVVSGSILCSVFLSFFVPPLLLPRSLGVVLC